MKPTRKVLNLARKIPRGKKTPAKCRAVHKYIQALKEMLAG